MSISAHKALQSDPTLRWFYYKTVEQYQKSRLEPAQAGLPEAVPPDSAQVDFNYDGVMDELNIRHLSYEALPDDLNKNIVPVYTVGDYKVVCYPDGTTAAMQKTSEGYNLFRDGKTIRIREPKEYKDAPISTGVSNVPIPKASGLASILESL